MTAPNNPFPALGRAIDPAILHSIHRASEATSTDFGLLMAQAAQESGFHADAKSSSSSASGLYQFIDSTWLDMVHRFGAKYGIGALAQSVGQDSTGKPVVTDAATRQKILDLRQDPTLSAALAGEYTKLNQTEIERVLGHGLGRADLYMAHFLGASGATTFLKAVETKGNIAAADLLPDAAAANKAVFYDNQTGKARTVADIYHSLASKIEKIASDFSTLVPSSPSSSAADQSASPASSSGASVAAMGQKIFASGLKLSNAVIEMLNVVALAALKLTGSDTPSQDALRPTAPSRERRSI
jgi:hypothetical protein